MTTTIVMDDAAIKAWGAAPVVIVPAIAGKIIMPVMALVQIDTSAGGYTGISSSAFILSSNGFSLAESNSATGLEEADGIYQSSMMGTLYQSSTNGLINSPLMFESLNGGVFGGGNAANKMTITVVYSLINEA